MRKPKYPKNSDRVYVAKMDIDGAKPMSGTCKCPVARAIKRRFSSSVDVYGQPIYIQIQVGNRSYNLCNKGKKFIEEFDQGNPVKPFHLYLTRA